VAANQEIAFGKEAGDAAASSGGGLRDAGVAAILPVHIYAGDSGSQEKHMLNVKANIYQNRAERAMHRREYLAVIDECQMGKARILKRNKKVSP
jgi:hypothetical protein